VKGTLSEDANADMVARGDYLQCGGPGGTAPSTGDLFPEKKEQTLLISSLFYILGVN
jgi:hypothetical protein